MLYFLEYFGIYTEILEWGVNTVMGPIRGHISYVRIFTTEFPKIYFNIILYFQSVG